MYRIGIDLGGTNIAAGVVNERYEIIGRSQLKTRLPRPQEDILFDLSVTARSAAEDAGILMEHVTFIGVGAPGAVDPALGIVRYSPNLAFENADIRGRLSADFGKPCGVCNDASAAAIGERIAGAGQGIDDFVAITLGTGLGAGVFTGGMLLTGPEGAGAELGHMVIQADGGELCSCGRTGCFETYCSARALVNATNRAMEQNDSTLMWALCGGDIRQVDGRTAFEAARLGDAAASVVTDAFISYLAVGVMNIINIFNPSVICLGGGVSNEREEDLLVPLRKRIEFAAYGGSRLSQTILVRAVLGNDAGIIGAAYLDSI